MQRKHMNSESNFYKNLGPFWEPMVDENGFLMEPMFTPLPDDAVATCKWGCGVQIELPPTSSGMQRILRGNLAQGKTDLVLTQCVAITNSSIVCYLGTIRVPRQYNTKMTYDVLLNPFRYH